MTRDELVQAAIEALANEGINWETITNGVRTLDEAAALVVDTVLAKLGD